MITDTMSLEEITLELKNDLVNVHEFVYKVMPKMRRQALKRRGRRYYQTFDFKTKKYNNWVVGIDYLKRDPSWINICCYVNHSGFNAVMVYADPSFKFVHFSGHFLDRYNERFIGGKLTSKSDILKEFMLRNGIAFTHCEHNDNKFLGCIEDGVILGYNEPDIDWTHCKTFITKDMTFQSQDESLKSRLIPCFEQYLDEVHKKNGCPRLLFTPYKKYLSPLIYFLAAYLDIAIYIMYI